jgi:hypothetical protein
LFSHWFAVFAGSKIMQHLIDRELEKDRQDL